MVKKVSKIFALAMVFIQILILMPNIFAAIGDSASVTLGQPDRSVIVNNAYLIHKLAR